MTWEFFTDDWFETRGSAAALLTMRVRDAFETSS
jgi:hypothetical protein